MTQREEMLLKANKLAEFKALPHGTCYQDDGCTKLFKSGYIGIWIQQDNGEKYYIIDSLDNESKGFKTMPTEDNVSKFVRSHRAQYDRGFNF